MELDEGKSADRRHHVRFWQVRANHWLGSATFDRGIGLSLFTLQITHHIGRSVDVERDAVARLLTVGGSSSLESIPGDYRRKALRNGGGDKYDTDGRVAHIMLGAVCKSGGGRMMIELGPPQFQEPEDTIRTAFRVKATLQRNPNTSAFRTPGSPLGRMIY